MLAKRHHKEFFDFVQTHAPCLSCLAYALFDLFSMYNLARHVMGGKAESASDARRSDMAMGLHGRVEAKHSLGVEHHLLAVWV